MEDKLFGLISQIVKKCYVIGTQRNIYLTFELTPQWNDYEIHYYKGGILETKNMVFIDNSAHFDVQHAKATIKKLDKLAIKLGIKDV